MTPLEIALLVIGVIIFALSFFLPEGNTKKTEKQIEDEQEEIRRLMEQELDGMKLKVNEAATETVDYAVDKAERSLERVSNEKIMAVNEYSQTIIEEINKNHQEVMFLYDMLKDKHTDLTNSVRKADAAAKEMETLSKNAVRASRGLKQELTVATVTRKGLTDEQRAIFDEVDVPVATANPVADVIEPEKAPTKVMDLMSNTMYHQEGAAFMAEPVTTPSVPEVPVSLGDNIPAAIATPNKPEIDPTNNNDKILKLHNEGVSTVDIAKELKLGVGEVKLVIDLFK